MTIANETRKIGVAAVLVALAAGCGGGADVEDAGQTPLVLNEAGYVSVHESASDPGYCGYLDLGTDELKNALVEEERYYYPVINRLLDEDPELQRYTGLSRVSSCNEARRFVKLNNEYHDQRPPSTADKDALFASFPRVPAEPPKRDPTAPVEKILGGVEDAIEEVIGFGFQIGAKRQNCTGVRLSGTLFLTAAHCMRPANDPIKPAKPPYIISFDAAWLKHVVNGSALGELYTTDPTLCAGIPRTDACHVLKMDGYMNPNFAGSNDRSNDVAVVHLRNESQEATRFAAEAADEFSTQVAFIATQTPKIGDPVESVGWGPNGNSDQGKLPGQWRLRHAATVPVDAVDNSGPSVAHEIYQGNWFSTTAAAGAQICKGDSGGPAYNDYRHVMGFPSLLLPADPVNKSCAAIGAAQYMSRTDYQILSFIPTAMYKLQLDQDKPLCTCVFVPASSDPTGSDREAPGAHIRCNEGCKDPTDWTQ